MRVRLVPSVLIFLSAYSPLSLIFLIQDFDFVKKEITHPWLVGTTLVVSVLSCILLWLSVSRLETSAPPITVKAVSRRSGELINYSIPYMISFVVSDMGNLKLMISFVFFMFILYWLTMRTHNIFINPVLVFMGYSIYNVHYERNGYDCEDLFLVKVKDRWLQKKVKDRRLQKNERCRIVEISEQLYVVTERSPEV